MLTMKTRASAVLALLLSSGVGGAASAQTVIYSDGFDVPPYAVGSISAQQGWATSQGGVQTPGLAAMSIEIGPELPASGIGYFRSESGSGSSTSGRFAYQFSNIGSANPPPVLAATDTARLLEAVGNEVTVEGDVIRTSESKSGLIFLNFQQAMRTGFVVVTFPADLPAFGDQKPKDRYHLKRIRIRGKLEKYKELPQIVLKQPGQIEVLGPIPSTQGTGAAP